MLLKNSTVFVIYKSDIPVDNQNGMHYIIRVQQLQLKLHFALFNIYFIIKFLKNLKVDTCLIKLKHVL